MLSYKSGIKSANSVGRERLNNIEFDGNFTFAEHTTYGLGGGCRGAFFPRTLLQARAVFDNLSAGGEHFAVVANGSDILASDAGYDGYVICTEKLRGIVRLNADVLFCLAGTPVSEILKYCSLEGLGGLEYLTGIPATIGGIACMNGGAGGRYISSDISGVKLYDGHDRNLSNKSCNFGYKQSTMRNIKCLILGVFLKVTVDLPQNVQKRISEFSSRRKGLPKGRSCGCVFKNVICADGTVLSAGALIEECGLKGLRCGGAFVSPEHCNFIINDGASSRQVFELIDEVRRRVRLARGIELEEEVVYIGKFD